MKQKALMAGLLCLSLVGASAGGADASPDAVSVADLSIEQLVNLEVTSVSKKEQRLGDAPAAIFVLSNDDLRRSGVTTIADALRLVPGMQVAAIDSGNWAISARGFNGQFGNKLLVMIDGRTIYSPFFSGVYWDAQQMLLEDVDRIEAIRGPGATVWGANAVNGVVNVVSKSARDTQGALIYGGGGDVHQALGGARYGDSLGDNTFYRIYGTYQLNDEYRNVTDMPANDGWDLFKGGFRLDHYTHNDGQLTWQGDAYSGRVGDRTGDILGFNTLGRWKQKLGERSSYEIQAFFDYTYRDDALAESSLSTVDLTFQHTFALGERNDVIWGAGYRYVDTRLMGSNTPAIILLDDRIPLDLFSAFIQDEFQLVPEKLTFTLGTELEHNDFTGFEVQPSARLTFKPTDKQTIWGAVSRAVRTPSESESKQLAAFMLGAPVIGPGGDFYVPTFLPRSGLNSETLLAYELGYRIQPSAHLSIDLATFYNDYDDLVGRQVTGFVPGMMVLQPFNGLEGESYGGEAAIAYAPTDKWRVSGTYSLLLVNIHGDPADEAETFERSAPIHQFTLRSSYDFTSKVSLDGQLRYVDNVNGIPAYLTADLRLSWRPGKDLELSLVGQNLLDASHPEQASSLELPTVEVPRGIYGKISWRF